MFVAIFVLAMLFGSGSFFGNVFKGPTPTPAPTVEVIGRAVRERVAPPRVESASPEQSASPVASPSAAPSPEPSAS